HPVTVATDLVEPKALGDMFATMSFRSACALAFLSGFLVLTMEVVLQHQFAQVSINSLFSSATVLVWVLLSLAAGSALVPLLFKIRVDASTFLRGVLVLAGVLCAAQPFLFTAMRGGVEILPYELTPAAYTFEVSKLGLIALCPAFIVAGLLFPILLQQASAGSASDTARNVALLLAWNGLGGWIGSELAQDVIVPRAGLWQSAVLVGLGYCLIALMVRNGANQSPAKTPLKRPDFVRWMPLSAGALVALAFFGAAKLPQVTVGPEERLAALEIGREGVVATVECAPGDWRMLFNNSYTLGGSLAKSNQERQAHIPILLHGNATSVAVLGVATGSTVAGAALHPNVQRIDAAELSPLVLGQAETFFGPYNRNVFADPRVRFVAEDARWMVASERETYDVVVGDLFLPWRTGEGRLFSVEHFQAVRRSLKPDGVFCQWLPLFQLTRPQFDAIARTFQEVFPEVLVVRGDFYTELPILGLIGGRDLSRINWQRVAERCAELRDAGAVTDPLSRHEDGVAMMIVGMLPAPDDGPVNTLANAWLEWNCGRNILGMKTPWFVGVPQAEFVRDLQRSANPLLPESLQRAHDSGQFFLTLEIAARLRLPVYADLHGQMTQRLPESLRHDASALWQEWPSRVKPRPILQTVSTR
ncbi:MAG TPA: hypothetical protein PKA41_17535, partial [Verrucomicrobiota bacterium]|nr:hypothetical protein [Verrucomicrobiota bacterium]